MRREEQRKGSGEVESTLGFLPHLEGLARGLTGNTGSKTLVPMNVPGSCLLLCIQGAFERLEAFPSSGVRFQDPCH